MKIIHCSDIHLGVERGPIDQTTHIPTRILDYLDSLDVVIDFAEEEHVDAFLIAGDVFHTSSPSPMLLSAFASRVKRISKTCPVVILVGNHDTPGPLYRKNAIDVFGELDISNIYVGDSFETLTLDTKSGALQVTTFPYPTRQLLGGVSKEEYPKKIFETLNYVRTTIKDLTVPAVFLGHFTVSGSKYGSERPMILDKEAEVELFDLLGWMPGDSYDIETVWDYIALGHIHHHQAVLDEPPVVYAGSLDRVDFGEENDDKGFVLVTIDKTLIEKGIYQKETSWEFVSIDPRPMMTVRIDARNKKRPRRYVFDEISKIDLSDSIARAIINVDSETVISNNEVIEAMYEAGAHWVKGATVSAPIEYTSRLELDNPLATYSTLELLEAYFDTDEYNDDEYEALLDLAEDIMSEE